MRPALYGITLLLLVWLTIIICYIGTLTILIVPGETKEAGAFTISRPEYVNTRYGRIVPVIIEGDTSITYTLVLSK